MNKVIHDIYVTVNETFSIGFIGMPELIGYMRENYEKWKELYVSRKNDNANLLSDSKHSVINILVFQPRNKVSHLSRT